MNPRLPRPPIAGQRFRPTVALPFPSPRADETLRSRITDEIMAYRAKIDGIEVAFDWTSRRWVSRDHPSLAKNLNAIPLESLVALARFDGATFPTSGALYINALAKVFGGEVVDVDNPARRRTDSPPN